MRTCDCGAGTSAVQRTPWLAASVQRTARKRSVACPARTPAQTPHSGFHLNNHDEFMEGWYFKVTDPESRDSVALIYSYEIGRQPDGAQGRVGVQAMGPQDSYIAQASTDTSTFWADRNALRLGAALKLKAGKQRSQMPRTRTPQVLFDDLVEEGFQASDTWHQGCIKHSSDALLGTVKSSIPYVHWAFSVRPVYGWGGGVDEQQQSTAGWLATLPALEPHWQVLMAHGLATGYVQWGPDKRIELKDTPLYAEKNWGQGFPKRWAWLQCNSFANCPDLAVTGAFAKRVALGSEENVGLIGVHHDGDFIEATPANGSVSWDVEPWGRWVMQGKSNKHEILAEATCSPDAGTVLRAPTGTQGLIPACKDTFAGDLRVRVWKLTSSGVRDGPPMIDETSDSAALEVGGGPWWHSWKEEARINPIVGATMQTPLERVAARLERLAPFEVPDTWKPPGY